MVRRLAPLTGDAVDLLPKPCRSCLAWELGERCPGGVDGTDDAGVVRKQAWVSSQLHSDRAPGRVLRVDDEVAGYVLFGPSAAFLAARGVTRPQPSPEALLLATLWVAPERRGHGLGRLLLQATLREAVQRELPAVEAFGDRRWRDREGILPATWLLHEGFIVSQEHPRTPLFRLDVHRTARWAESLEHALEEVLGRMPRPVRVPQPERAPVSRAGPVRPRRGHRPPPGNG